MDKLHASKLENLYSSGLLWVPEKLHYNNHAPFPSFFSPSPLLPRASFNGVSIGISEIDSQLPHGGLPWGSVHEWFYSEKLAYPPHSFFSLLAARAQKSFRLRGINKFIVWIGREVWPAPFFLKRLEDLSISHCLFIDPPSFALKQWATIAALSSSAVAITIADISSASSKGMKIGFTKKLALAAKKGGGIAFIVRESNGLTLLSAAQTRWILEPRRTQSYNPAFTLKLLKVKGSYPQKNEWDIELYSRNDDEEVCLRLSEGETWPEETLRTGT